MSETKPCIYGLHKYCIVYKHLKENNIDVSNWGSTDWIRLHCAMCVKAVYAKAKKRLVSKYTVVNTL